MAFPTFISTSGNSGANATTHTVNIPQPVTSGNLLLVFFANDSTATASVTTPAAGWSTFGNCLCGNTDSVASARLTAFSRIADGAEASSITVTTSANEASAYVSTNINNWYNQRNRVTIIGGYELTASSGNSANADPPLETPSFGSGDTLWFAVMANDGNVGVTAYPTNYGLQQQQNRWANTNAASIAFAARQLGATAQDPGTFTQTTEQWAAFTVGIRENLDVRKEYTTILGLCA